MRRTGRNRGLGLAVVLCGFLATAASGESAPVTGTTAHFEIVAPDQASLSKTVRLAEHVARTAERLLGAGVPARFPQRVLVRLRPEPPSESGKHYAVRTEAGGFVTLTLRWHRGLTLEQTTLALADGFLARLAILEGGPEGAARMRRWVAEAVGVESYLALRSAEVAGFWREQRATGRPDLGNMVSAKGPGPRESATAARQGYWLLKALRRSGVPRGVIGELLRGGLMGRDTRAHLRQLPHSGAGGADLDADQWWRERWRGMAGERRALYESMDASREWIAAMADFGDYGGEDATPPNLRELWERREAPALREILRARRELIGLRLERVNPAYFNAARSLGALYETVLEAGEAHRFLRELTGFLGDFEDAKALHEAVDAALAAE